eukprot:6709162-Karenia_brevis.AAC.1
MMLQEVSVPRSRFSAVRDQLKQYSLKGPMTCTDAELAHPTGGLAALSKKCPIRIFDAIPRTEKLRSLVNKGRL